MVATSSGNAGGTPIAAQPYYVSLHSPRETKHAAAAGAFFAECYLVVSTTFINDGLWLDGRRRSPPRARTCARARTRHRQPSRKHLFTPLIKRLPFKPFEYRSRTPPLSPHYSRARTHNPQQKIACAGVSALHQASLSTSLQHVILTKSWPPWPFRLSA